MCFSVGPSSTPPGNDNKGEVIFAKQSQTFSLMNSAKSSEQQLSLLNILSQEDVAASCIIGLVNHFLHL